MLFHLLRCVRLEHAPMGNLRNTIGTVPRRGPTRPLQPAIVRVSGAASSVEFEQFVQPKNLSRNRQNALKRLRSRVPGDFRCQ
jgi:hypothetical protein